MSNPIEEQKNVITYYDKIRFGVKNSLGERKAASIHAQYAREDLMRMRKAGLRCVHCCSVCSRYWYGQCQLLARNVDPNWICKHFDLYKED